MSENDMFREIRRKSKEISIGDAEMLLETERRGVLAVNGDDGYPYAVPLNYLYVKDEGKIYFHGSRVGHNMDSIPTCD
ncbi:MAG: pyridoxamine 5'-phosphate oxidase family protein, partial [Clostridia bacterium]|nr:pyridoxamine 5'-phosphate oxidase family protein [Clostridia bacterium]